MSNISTFGTFTSVKLGIYAASRGLSVTGNNISNINTDGYTRQRVDQISLYTGAADRYSSQTDVRIGGGALVIGVDQVRDQYLDIQYRNEQANVGSAEAFVYGYTRIADVIDEVAKGNDGEGVIEAQLNDIIEQIENLTTQGAGLEEYDTLVRASVYSLCSKFHMYADELDQVYSSQLDSFYQDVTAINTTLENIRNLNEEIRRANIYGSDALELKDERNLLIDELSKYMRISVTYGEEDLGSGKTVEKLTIRLAGDDPDNPEANTATLVDGVYATQLLIRQEPVYVTDENGEYVTDDDGNKIQLTQVNGDGEIEYVYQDSENLEIDLDALRDWRGRPMPMGTTQGYLEDTAGNDLTFTDTQNEDGTTTTGAELVNAEIDKMAAELVLDGYTVEWNDAYNGFSYTDENGNTYTYQAMEVEETTTTTDDNGDPVESTENVWKIWETKDKVSEKVELTDTTLYGYLQSERELLTEKGPFATKDDIAGDANATSKYGIKYYMYALDALANKFADIFNSTNAPQAVEIPMLDSNTDPVYLATEMKNGVLYFVADENSGLTQDQLEVKYVGEGEDRHVELTEDQYELLPEDVMYNGVANGKGYGTVTDKPLETLAGILISNDSNKDDATGITASNISISLGWSTGDVRIVNSFTSSNSTANDNYQHLLSQLMNGEFEFTPADLGFNDAYAADVPFYRGTIQGMLANINEQLANDTSVENTLLTNYNTMADELWVERDAVMGVDLNDETINLMQYQKAYQAACRVMTVFDSMLDKLINGTAV